MHIRLSGDDDISKHIINKHAYNTVRVDKEWVAGAQKIWWCKRVSWRKLETKFSGQNNKENRWNWQHWQQGGQQMTNIWTTKKDVIVGKVIYSEENQPSVHKSPREIAHSQLYKSCISTIDVLHQASIKCDVQGKKKKKKTQHSSLFWTPTTYDTCVSSRP